MDVNSQLTLQPEAHRWSVVQCLVHLNLSSESFIAKIERACSEARHQQLLSAGPFKKDRRVAILRWHIMPPARIRVRTEKLEPSIVGPADKALPRFLTLQSELQKSLKEAEGLDLNRIMLTSPVSRFIRYNLFSCFEIILAHQLRHLWQIEHVKADLGLNRELYEQDRVPGN